MRGLKLGSLLLATALLPGCTNRESFGASYDLRWVGTVTPEAGRCGSARRGTMTMVAKDRSVVFTPSDGALVLHGIVGRDGNLRAELELRGPDHRPFPLRLDAVLNRAGVIGSYTTPICRERVELHPAKPLPARLFAPGNILGIGNS
ncbi:MAG TPA: hypothetical protein VNF49_10275 [Candidatus Binataceae bacterium]|nr:hypothetical protein [Candidatus Binataceae bacterium]